MSKYRSPSGVNMDLARGWHPWDAVIDATTNRLRPIVLTAAAASLGMIPIASEVFLLDHMSA